MGRMNSPLLIGQAEEVDLVPPAIRSMIENEGVYVCGDTNAPEFDVPIISMGGKLFSIVIDEELNPERFLPTLTINGPFRKQDPAGDELAKLQQEIADDGAISTLESECAYDDEGEWLDTNAYDIAEPTAELRYLELRGLLERHPERPELVRVKEMGDV